MNLHEREKAFEDLFAHDEELHFKIRAHRNSLAGQWAAQKLGKGKDAAHDYAQKIVSTFMNRQQLFDKLKADFILGGIAITDMEITQKLIDFVNQSRQHFMG